MDETITYILGTLGVLILALIVIGGVFGGNAIYKSYKVWAYAKDGEADLARANYDRQIAVTEAVAKKEAAKSLAEAEIERATGVAEANRIIAGSITENYLRYLYVEGLKSNQMQTIYIPVEGMLPVMDISTKD